MQAELPALSHEWKCLLGGALAIGVGINTGPAMVGNTGSRLKFKYGPLGHTVNLGSRVEGATKYFGVPILITGSTQAKLGGALATRRLCRVRVVGVSGAVELHQLHSETATPDWLTTRDAYEKALGLFENANWVEACRSLYPLLSGHEGHYDIPSLELASRAINCLKTPPDPFDSVVELPGK
jgi:adenylate cyclase